MTLLTHTDHLDNSMASSSSSSSCSSSSGQDQPSTVQERRDVLRIVNQNLFVSKVWAEVDVVVVVVVVVER